MGNLNVLLKTGVKNWKILFSMLLIVATIFSVFFIVIAKVGIINAVALSTIMGLILTGSYLFGVGSTTNLYYMKNVLHPKVYSFLINWFPLELVEDKRAFTSHRPDKTADVNAENAVS